MDTINNKYKEIRKALNLTQKEIAAKLEMTNANWNRVEKGVAPLTEKNKNLLIERLNINPKFFTDDNAPVLAPIPPRDELKEDLLYTWGKIKKDATKKLINKVARVIQETEDC